MDRLLMVIGRIQEDQHLRLRQDGVIDLYTHMVIWPQDIKEAMHGGVQIKHGTKQTQLYIAVSN
jgi:hypothetical protein